MITLSEFEEMCRRHDWFFQYSDDHRAWEAGRDESHKISLAQTDLEEQGLGDQAEAIFEKYKPKAGF